MKNIQIIILSVITMAVILWIVVKFNRTTDYYLYGNSLRQNRMVNTIRLHKYGITGQRITVGIIDAGFYTLHPVFSKTKIIKEYDFATKVNTTFNREHLLGVDHGTNVFSVLGGYKVNKLIGIAYGAEYILAKTDISTDRLFQEETNAVNASKWLCEMGANIITTSLSFNKFDNADYYYPEQMDGTVAAITKIADSLVRKGVVYCCSAGNNYENDWHIIEPPGDGFNVLAVGSVDKNRLHSFFSSCGPTADGRIKPDIVAPGEGVWNANYLPKLKSEFGWNHGTSLSAAIAAGIAALILSAHPDLSSNKVIEAIKSTSSNSNSPDILYGYGIPDAEKAVSYYGPAFSNTPELNIKDNKLEINTYVFSSYGLDTSSVKAYILTDNSAIESVYKMKLKDDNYFSLLVNITPNTKKVKVYFRADDFKGQATRYPTGILGDCFVLYKADDRIEIQ